MAQLSPIHSWKRMVPWVVSAVKSGATSLIRSDITIFPLQGNPNLSCEIENPPQQISCGWAFELGTTGFALRTHPHGAAATAAADTHAGWSEAFHQLDLKHRRLVWAMSNECWLAAHQA